MTKKTLWFDVETTGLSAYKNAIIQFACLVDIDGKIEDEKELKIAPLETDEIEDAALKVNGITRVELTQFRTAPEVLNGHILPFFNKWINKFDITDKFAFAGFNVGFDIDFLKQFFWKNKERYFGSYFNGKRVDPLYQLYSLDYQNKLCLPNNKLGTACKHFDIEIEAHDALSDIRATRELYFRLLEL